MGAMRRRPGRDAALSATALAAEAAAERAGLRGEARGTPRGVAGTRRAPLALLKSLRVEFWLLSTQNSTRSFLTGGGAHGRRTNPCPSPRNPRVPGVSWRPQPARAATRRPG